jgi:shikimate dehydrogenase
MYQNFELTTIDKLPGLLKWLPDLAGLNVTIPYKETVIPYLHSLDDAAKAIGAVNTITIENKKLKGYNTDYLGFTQSIQPLLLPTDTHALILGTGGSAKAVAYALQLLGISHQSVSRNPKEGELAYQDLTASIIQQHQIIVNCTPTGMFPNIDDCPPIPYEGLTDKHLLFDLIYNPPETVFLQKGTAVGARTKNGLEMLHLQADEAWHIWSETF